MGSIGAGPKYNMLQVKGYRFFFSLYPCNGDMLVKTNPTN